MSSLLNKPVLTTMMASAIVVAALGTFLLPMSVVCAEAEMVRPSIGTPLQDSQDLLRAGKYQEAMAALNTLASVPDKTPYEIYMIDRTRVAIASASGDDASSIKASEAIIQSGYLPAAEQAKFVRALASLLNKQKDYKKTIALLSRFPQESEADPKMRGLLVQAYYHSDDFARASQALLADILADEKLDRIPARNALQMLSNCALKLGDKAGYAGALEKLVAYYPSADYWAELLYRLETRSSFAPRLLLDIYRLRYAVGDLSKAADFMEMGRLALLAGFPAEAKGVLNRGFETGILGTGTDAVRHKRMRDLAIRKAVEDMQSVGAGKTSSGKGKDEAALVNLGFALVSTGAFDKGIKLMEQGLQKAAVKHAEDAKLHLAYAHVMADRRADAIQLFKNVQGSDGTADLARYWVMHLEQPVD